MEGLSVVRGIQEHFINIEVPLNLTSTSFVTGAGRNGHIPKYVPFGE